MCFLPKSQASNDQAPGPIIARVAPRTPRMAGKRGRSGSKKQSTLLLSLLELRRPGSINLPPVKFRQALLYFGAPQSRKPALHSDSRRKNKAEQLLGVAVV
jgi:hypothetical protein